METLPPHPPAPTDQSSPESEAGASPFSAGLSQQAVLFSDFDGCFAEQPALVEAGRKYLHTGKTASRNEELCEAIVTAYASGLVSIRSLAKRLHVGRETIKVIVGMAERAGKLGPLKERIAGKMGRGIELGMELLLERLESGDVPSNVLPIVVGVLVDKKALLDGEATVRVETVAKGITADQVRAEWEAMRRAIECESTVCPATTADVATMVATTTGQGHDGTGQDPATDGGRGGSQGATGPRGPSPSDGKTLIAKEAS